MYLACSLSPAIVLIISVSWLWDWVWGFSGVVVLLEVLVWSPFTVGGVVLGVIFEDFVVVTVLKVGRMGRGYDDEKQSLIKKWAKFKIFQNIFLRFPSKTTQ